MSGEEREGFLSRWSRRKREAAEAPSEPEAPPLAEPLADFAEPVADAAPPLAAEPASADASEAPVTARPAAGCPIPNLPEIDLASLPPVEELTASSDFAAFLRPGVPTLLRNAALRRMWSLDPAIRDYIGPVEYQWDFNTPGGLPLGFSNELGGDVAKLLAQAIGQRDPDEPEPEPEPEPAAEPGTEPGEAPEEQPEALVAEAPPEPAPALDETPAPATDTPADTLPARRRHGGALPA